MKKFTSIITSVSLILCVTSCKSKTESFDKALAYENMRNYYAENANDSDDYYLQISKTQAEAHVMTEACKYGDDYCFLEYDIMGALKFFRNNTLTNVSPETFYQAEDTDAQWSDFSYQKTSDTYRNVLALLSSDEYSKSDSQTYAVKEIAIEETENKEYPYKISAHFDMDKINAKELFASGGNFGSVSIKFLTDETGKNFEDISIYVQYDFNDDIYVISSTYGELNLPDEKGDNGQRPEDIEKEYEKNLAELQASFEEYLQNVQIPTE